MPTPITESTKGTTLKKYLEEEEFELPTIVYEFVSNRNSAVTVELVEHIPDELDLEHIGFHRDYGGDQWTVGNETLQFKRELEPDSTYKTVLAVRPDSPITASELIIPPDEFTVHGPQPPDVSAGTTDSFTRSSSSDTGNDSEQSNQPSSPRQMDADIDSVIPETESADRSNSDEKSTNADEVADDERTYADSNDAIIEQLVTAIDAGDLSEEDLQALREELIQTNNSVNARIKQLQSEFADLRAYIGALEEFLEDHGSGAEIIDRFEKEVESNAAEIESLENKVDQHESRISTVQGDAENHDEELASISSELSSVAEDVSTLQSDVSELVQRIPDEDLEERITAIENELSEVIGFVSRLEEALE